MKGGTKRYIKKLKLYHHIYWIPISASNADKQLIELQTRILEEMIKESRSLFWFSDVRINRATNSKQSVFSSISLDCLSTESVQVITLAFVRVAIQVTCLACTKSLVNNSVVIALNFLMKHGQKKNPTKNNSKHAQKESGDCSLQNKLLAFLLKQLFCPFMPATPHLHFMEIVSALRFTGPVTQIFLPDF